MFRCTDLPFDLWHLFISLACTDDGTTARSLSATNRMLRELSQPFRYTTITLIHAKQIIAFEDHISGIPPHLRPIKNLFVSFNPDVGAKELGALYRILTLISSTLEILSIHNALCLPIDYLLPYLPALRDLALFRRLWFAAVADYPTWDPIAVGAAQFPALEYLHLEGSAERASNLTPLETLAPVLKRFYVSFPILWCHFTDPPDCPVWVEELVIPRFGEYRDAHSMERSLIRHWSALLPEESQKLLYDPEGPQLSRKLRFTDWVYQQGEIDVEIWKADCVERINGRVILSDRTEFPFPIEETVDNGVEGHVY